MKPAEIAAAAAAASSGADESPLLSASADLGPSADLDLDLDANDADPEPNDELERLTEKTWEIFGDHLRFFTKDPTLESADFKTTLGLLRRFLPHTAEADRPGSSEASAVAGASGQGKDPEAASASGVSSDAPGVGTGASVSSATGGAGAGNISAPTTTGRILALILLELLRAPEPDHSVDLADIKKLVKEWYSGAVAAGRESPPEGADTEQGTDTLATQAVYGMVAKRGFKVRRMGRKALVRFT